MELMIGITIGLFIGMASGVAAVILIAMAGNELKGQQQ
ncbi:hypothetical protein C7M51_01609 [Mixta intestinalis]|uniref:Uncharacterized protein n=1 Tax=Mixta intestinalis TaxID=1615494 RepID=A0A6P1PY90_9GAMM|nr:hypothetical protein C7M51_01609 [Mixta intestinalis]